MKAKHLLFTALLLAPASLMAQLTDLERQAIVDHIADNMVRVEGGTFQMGSKSGDKDEKPVHQVTLSSFSICRFEVTQREWAAVMGNTPSGFQESDDLPVEKVSWDDCQAFLAKLNQLTGKNYRLPTEAEWEFAARGGNLSRGYDFSGNISTSTVAWDYNNSGQRTHSVGTNDPNELGLYDMSGNVWEWCQDWWANSYPSSPQTNPTGPALGTCRVFRGGCWHDDVINCRVASRDYSAPGRRDIIIGFRLAL